MGFVVDMPKFLAEVRSAFRIESAAFFWKTEAFDLD
jgi:hypothetical protein